MSHVSAFLTKPWLLTHQLRNRLKRLQVSISLERSKTGLGAMSLLFTVQTGRGDRKEKRSCNLELRTPGKGASHSRLGVCSSHAPGDRHGRPEAARPRGRGPGRRAPQEGQTQRPQAGPGQLRPRALGLPGTPAPSKSILMAVAVHADSLAPHPQSSLVSSLEAGPSPRSCRRRLRAPFTFFFHFYSDFLLDRALLLGHD